MGKEPDHQAVAVTRPLDAVVGLVGDLSDGVAGEVGQLSALAKAALTRLTLAATAYSRALGQRLMRAGHAPVKGGTTPLR
jgi:hypothetical protein